MAAENFWGNIAAQIGGRDVTVTSLITSPTADPHLFQTNAVDAALLARAKVVVENGAGYDSWMRSLLAADGGNPRLVDAATVLHVTGSDPNPHLWYDLPRGAGGRRRHSAGAGQGRAARTHRRSPGTWRPSTPR